MVGLNLAILLIHFHYWEVDFSCFTRFTLCQFFVLIIFIRFSAFYCQIKQETEVSYVV